MHANQKRIINEWNKPITVVKRPSVRQIAKKLKFSSSYVQKTIKAYKRLEATKIK